MTVEEIKETYSMRDIGGPVRFSAKSQRIYFLPVSSRRQAGFFKKFMSGISIVMLVELVGMSFLLWN